MKRWSKENREYLNEHRILRNAKARLEGIAAYGGRCVCCGESRVEFLTLEHKRGIKNHEKRGAEGWLQLKRDGFPKGDHEVLCYNCNCAKGVYGKCPHKM